MQNLFQKRRNEAGRSYWFDRLRRSKRGKILAPKRLSVLHPHARDKAQHIKFEEKILKLRLESKSSFQVPALLISPSVTCDHKISTGPPVIPVRHLRNSLKTQQKARLATTRTHKKRSNACTRDAILTAGKNSLLQRKRTTTKTEEESPERNTEDTITRERESGGLEIYTTIPRHGAAFGKTRETMPIPVHCPYSRAT